jgi:hypothetical protein
MIGKGGGNEPETDAVQRFGALLSWHLNRGTRPDGLPDTEGVPWTIKRFAAAVGANERSVRAWRAGKYSPMDLQPIERELFGYNRAYQDFRNELRRRYRLTRGGDQSSEGGVDRTTSELESRIENRRAAEPGMALSMPGQNSTDLIATEFQESVALFTVGAGQTVFVARPELALIGFRNLMNRLWAIDKADSQERILVWTLDLGRQDFEDPESRLRFMNVESLVSRFKAMMRFKEGVTEARWNWLQSRAVIVLHDTRSVRPDVPRLPAFDPQHVLFSAIPPRWAGSPEFLALYGHERLQETNYTVFLRKSAVESSQGIAFSDGISSNAYRNYELHYFGHALLKSDEKGERELRGVKLRAPGGSGYVEALGTVFLAATHLLGLRSAPAELSIGGMKIDPAHAIEKLRHHGFLLLRLDQFMTF